MKQKRANKMVPIAFAITTASALSAMALQSLPDVASGGDLAPAVTINPTSVGYVADQLNIYENDLNPLLGAPLYDIDRNVAGYVSELMVSADGNVRGMVLAVSEPDDEGVKRVAAEAAEFRVINPANGDAVVLAQLTQSELQSRPEFAPDYATDYH